MDILDIHTHRMPVELGQAIQNCQPAEFDPLAGAYYSVGIHPWYLTRENLDRQWEMLLAAIQCPQVLAIGEAGLDKLVRTDYMLQQEVFEKQAMLARNEISVGDSCSAFGERNYLPEEKNETL